MTSLNFWNCRGANKKEASLYLKEIVKDNEGCFIGLVETKITNLDRTDVDKVIGKDWDFFHHPSEGNSGGIITLWNKNIISFEVLDHSSQAIIGMLKSPLFGNWMVGTVYANKDYRIRRNLWEMIEKATIEDIPSIIGGDFNCLLSNDDKRGGKRFLFSKETWNSYPAAKSIVSNAWRKSDYGNDMEILQKKLKRSLRSLYFWSRSKCKCLNSLKEELKIEISNLQLEESSLGGLSDEKLKLLRSKVNDFNITLKRLSTWWNQRAKVRWHEEGDVNSNFFHNFALAKRNGNLIRQIKNDENILVEDVEQISAVFQRFFEKKWYSKNCNLDNWPHFPEDKKLNDLDIKLLSSDFTEEELKTAVFQQGRNKSSGLDGVSPVFFQNFWNIVKDSTWRAVDKFFKSGYMIDDWKDTLIVLIPKIKHPTVPSNFKPISLCQTSYKLVATMLVNRIKLCISKLISEEQIAFMSGRSMSDHCLLSQEIFNKFKTSKDKRFNGYKIRYGTRF
ncbi:uncharacterized protein LOC110115793 [Dendrobium catenatum]|uniref:uncharacterized protein LOC110115793 n=1 Tax=Dendrobium catenatum TaxID=906689 RepID=UPI0009F1A43D|nr:uncharacterized protein LOC110115793 [Dendrobium catenatum]